MTEQANLNGNGRQRRIPFEGVKNFRDLGGYPASGGRSTCWGLVYRSGRLHNFTEGDFGLFAGLGVRAVFDLRDGTERGVDPDPVPSVHLPVLDELAGEEGVGILRATTAREAEEAVARIYTGLLRRRARVYGQLLSSLADPANRPAVVHCTAGKDRTGIAAALLLGALGVDRATVLYDYELTGQEGYFDADSLRRTLAAAGVASAAADVVVGAPAAPLARALEELDRAYGGTEEYLLGPAGLEPGTLRELRQALTEVGPVGAGSTSSSPAEPPSLRRV
ncbi:MAG: tyrosine-protein phosphatase [Actinomycetota bacterium]|nr:tyrosine-protein phosphatase [Actinomycetota bacterium]